ncbi:MAG: hypothetical protein IH946_07150, partial [Bacteroidetes bacterium]|nr:hypothetical protein [Bacteroidota bacterium]
MSRYLYILLIVMFYAFHIQAQNALSLYSNLRTKRIPVSGDTIRIDTLSLMPGTLTLENGTDIYPAGHYYIDESSARLAWKKRPEVDSITARYKVLPYDLSKAFFHKDFKKIDSIPEIDINPFVYSPYSHQYDPFDFGKLDYNGS